MSISIRLHIQRIINLNRLYSEYYIIKQINIVIMGNDLKLLGITKVSVGSRISLLKDVSSKLGIAKGDKLLFIMNDEGEILIRKA